MDFVKEFDDEENRESDDEKIDNILEKETVRDDGGGFVRDGGGDGDRKAGEIATTAENGDDGHNNIRDKRVDDFTKGASDNNTNGEIKDIATIDEIGKFLEKTVLFGFRFLHKVILP